MKRTIKSIAAAALAVIMTAGAVPAGLNAVFGGFDTSIVANAIIIPDAPAVSVSPSDGGTVGSELDGDAWKFTAMPAAEYYFEKWTYNYDGTPLEDDSSDTCTFPFHDCENITELTAHFCKGSESFEAIDLSKAEVTVDPAAKTVTVTAGDKTISPDEYHVTFFRYYGTETENELADTGTEFPTSGGNYIAAVTANDNSNICYGEKKSGTFTVGICLKNLKVGDILPNDTDYFSGSPDCNQLYVKAGAGKKSDGTVLTSRFSAGYKGHINADGSIKTLLATLSPIDENGKDATEWEVLEVQEFTTNDGTDAKYYEVIIGGKRAGATETPGTTDTPGTADTNNTPESDGNPKTGAATAGFGAIALTAAAAIAVSKKKKKE